MALFVNQAYILYFQIRLIFRDRLVQKSIW